MFNNSKISLYTVIKTLNPKHQVGKLARQQETQETQEYKSDLLSSVHLSMAPALQHNPIFSKIAKLFEDEISQGLCY